MYNLKIILILICITSCSPQKKLQRLVKKNPELKTQDTLTVINTVIIDSVSYDTTTKFIEHKTVEVINNERVRLVYRYDTITNDINHYIEVKGDTIVQEIKVPFETIVVEEKKTPLSFWIICTLVVIAFTLLLMYKTK